MNIFDYAMKMEMDGKDYYLEMAAKSPTRGFKTILTMLAENEVRHYNAVKAMKNRQYSLEETPILNNVKNVFEEMKDQHNEISRAGDQGELYRKAQDVEKKSEDFYREKAAENDNEQVKTLFEKIAEEEKRHYYLLENMIELLRRPKEWLENAEWSHLETY
jgi:rubrerythrin